MNLDRILYQLQKRLMMNFLEQITNLEIKISHKLQKSNGSQKLFCRNIILLLQKNI